MFHCVGSSRTAESIALGGEKDIGLERATVEGGVVGGGTLRPSFASPQGDWLGCTAAAHTEKQ